MSYIKNISAGENIVIENLGDDSIRIHNNFSTQNLTGLTVSNPWQKNTAMKSHSSMKD